MSSLQDVSQTELFCHGVVDSSSDYYPCDLINRQVVFFHLSLTIIYCQRDMKDKNNRDSFLHLHFVMILFLATREVAWYIISVVSVCLTVCQTITFERIDRGS